MDNTKIYKVFLKSKRFEIYEHEGTQWLGDGIAAYSMLGMPHFDKETVLPLIGVDDMSKASYDVAQFDTLPNAETIMPMQAEGDGTLIPTRLQIGTSIMLKGSGSNAPKCIFCDAVRMKPFLGDSQLEYVSRTTKNNEPIVVVKYGMITVGCIIPWDPAKVLPTTFENVETAYIALKEAVKNQNADDKTSAEQLRIEESIPLNFGE